MPIMSATATAVAVEVETDRSPGAAAPAAGVGAEADRDMDEDHMTKRFQHPMSTSTDQQAETRKWLERVAELHRERTFRPHYFLPYLDMIAA
jgi:hypothetical protein